jgi:hypothetical protein
MTQMDPKLLEQMADLEAKLDEVCQPDSFLRLLRAADDEQAKELLTMFGDYSARKAASKASQEAWDQAINTISAGLKPLTSAVVSEQQNSEAK